MTIQSDLLSQIAEYIAVHGPMSETTFGIFAVNDGKLVMRLRAGRNMTLATINRVQQFLRGEVGPAGSIAGYKPRAAGVPPKVKGVRRRKAEPAPVEQPLPTAKAA